MIGPAPRSNTFFGGDHNPNRPGAASAVPTGTAPAARLLLREGVVLVGSSGLVLTHTCQAMKSRF